MKRKLISVGLALVLALSLSLVAAVPVGAVEEFSPTVTFRTGGTGTAAWSAEQQHSGLRSAKLATVATDDHGGVRFEFAPGELILDDLTALSYWEYVSARENPLDVFVDIWLDFDGDGDADADDYPGYMQAEPLYTVGAAPLNTWTSIDAMNLKWSTFVGPDDPYHAPTISDFQANTSEPCVHGYTMADWNGGVDFGPLSILRIDVRVGYGGTWANFTGYADDIVVNSYAQSFEPLAEVWVDDDFSPSTIGWGYNSFAVVQDGVNAVAEAGTVNVAVGTYVEPKPQCGLYINKPLTLLGAQANVEPVAGGRPSGESVITYPWGIAIEANDVVINGFEINPTSMGAGAEISGYGITDSRDGETNNVQILYNYLHNNYDRTNFAAIVLMLNVGAPYSATYNDYVISHNYVDWSNMPGVTTQVNAIHLGGGGVASIQNRIEVSYNTINPTYNLYRGIAMIYPSATVSSPVIMGNEVHNCHKAGIEILSMQNADISGNMIENADHCLTVSGNLVAITGNAFKNGDLRINSPSQNVDVTYNDFYFNAVREHSAARVCGGSDTSTIRFNYNNFFDGGLVEGTLALVNDEGNAYLNALYNWWGDVSGPSHSPGCGARVGDNVLYNPWLFEPVVPGEEPVIYDRTLALRDGWTLVSTDGWINASSGNSTWVGKILIAYTHTVDRAYEGANLTDLVPVDAIYVKTDGCGAIGIIYSGNVPTASVKDLGAGWNLISSANPERLNARAVLSPLRWIDVGEEQGIGLTTLVSQGYYNQYTDNFYLSTLTDADWGDGSLQLIGDGVGGGLAGVTLNPFDGYWAYMNAPKSFGVIPQ